MHSRKIQTSLLMLCFVALCKTKHHFKTSFTVVVCVQRVETITNGVFLPVSPVMVI